MTVCFNATTQQSIKYMSFKADRLTDWPCVSEWRNFDCTHNTQLWLTNSSSSGSSSGSSGSCSSSSRGNGSGSSSGSNNSSSSSGGSGGSSNRYVTNTTIKKNYTFRRPIYSVILRKMFLLLQASRRKADDRVILYNTPVDMMLKKNKPNQQWCLYVHYDTQQTQAATTCQNPRLQMLEWVAISQSTLDQNDSLHHWLQQLDKHTHTMKRKHLQPHVHTEEQWSSQFNLHQHFFSKRIVNIWNNLQLMHL